jgi:hypothetical protein
MKTKLSRLLRRTAIALLVVSVLGLAAAFILHRAGPRKGSVAEAKARVKSAREDLSMAIRATNATEHFVQKIGLSNSSTARAIHGMGDKLVQAAYRRDATAQIQVTVTEMGEHLVAVATNPIARFDDYNQVQEAYAALTLAGIEDALIRPHGRSKAVDGPASFELLTRSDLAAKAIATIRDAPVCRVMTSSDHATLIQATDTLGRQAIRSTIRYTRLPGQGDMAAPIFTVFVAQTDEDAARNFLGRRP